jgi:hypothetical protein
MRKIFKITFIIIALLQSVLLVNAQEFLSVVPTPGSLLDAIQGDVYIKPKSGIASEFQPGEGIEFSFDGNMNTMYHSRWMGATVFPVTLDYIFDKSVSLIDYAVYYPRQTGSNGHIIEVEVWYAAAGGSMTKYKDYNFGGENTPSTVVFEPAIVNPDTIRFVVKSGTGDGEGNYVACAEMEFYRKTGGFDYKTIFTDATCSELKPGITTADINAIGVEFYRKLASDIFYGHYDFEFRVQEYPAYRTPNYMRDVNKSARYGQSDGVTGIYVGNNSDVVLLVETESTVMPSLFVHNIETVASGTSFALRKGMNKIRVTRGGIMYIRYYTQTGTEPPAKINIVNGIVNGFYDKSKHTPADWPRLLDKATYPLFQMKGDYVLLSFDLLAFRNNAKNNGPELLDYYDDLVWAQMDFQGLVKYNKMYDTRMCLFVDPSPTVYMYATDYYTGYSKGSQSNILNVNRLTDKNMSGDVPAWGPAHEVGHVNQTRPGFRWLGMTEVSNNVLSEFILNRWGIKSRLLAESRYGSAISQIVKDTKVSNYLQHNDVFCRLVPFWQLKIYMHNVLGNEDFYKDVYEKVRVNPNPTAGNGCTMDANCMLEFVYLTCQVSGLDMTDFFTDWKFLTPASFIVDDYSTNTVTISQQGIDALKAKIQAIPGISKPPVPEGKNLYDINDSNWESYKMP